MDFPWVSIRINVDDIRLELAAADDEKRALSLSMAPFAALKISAALDGHRYPRPDSYDLLASLIALLGAAVHHVVFTPKGGAQVVMETRSGTLVLDAPPQDAVGLALYAPAPIALIPPPYPDLPRTPRPVPMPPPAVSERRRRRVTTALNYDASSMMFTETRGGRSLTIPIGFLEADNIRSGSASVFGLMKRLLESLGTTLREVVIREREGRNFTPTSNSIHAEDH